VTYDKNLQFISSAEVEKGHGARHLLFSPDGRYAFCANELASTVTAFRYADGMLRKLETVHTLPQPYKGESSVAAIRITSDGKNLYVSNRGHDSISCFLVNEGSLTLTEVVNCGGMSPRDFNITPDGRFLLCANENSDTVTIFKMNDGKLIKTHIELTLKSPLCVIFN